MYNKLQYGGVTHGTSTGSTTCTAAIAAVSGKQHHVVAAQAGSDLATSVLLIKDGITTIFQHFMAANRGAIEFPAPLPITSGASCSATITGTNTCTANIQVITV